MDQDINQETHSKNMKEYQEYEETPKTLKKVVSIDPQSLLIKQNRTHYLKQVIQQKQQEKDAIQERELNFDRLIKQMLPEVNLGARQKLFAQKSIIQDPEFIKLDTINQQQSGFATSHQVDHLQRDDSIEKILYENLTQDLQVNDLINDSQQNSFKLPKESSSINEELLQKLSSKKKYTTPQKSSINDNKFNQTMSVFQTTNHGSETKQLSDSISINTEANSPLIKLQRQQIELTEQEQRSQLRQYRIEQDLHASLLNDPLLLSLIEIKIQDDINQSQDQKQNITKGKLEKLIQMLLMSDQQNSDQQKIITQVGQQLKRYKNLTSQDQGTAMIDKNNLFDQFKNDIQNTIQYNLMVKNFASSVVKMKNEKNPEFKFFEECIKGQVLSLPILFKIVNKKLSLQEYTLNTGLCESLTKAFQTLPQCINQLSLTQNGLKDPQLAIILKSCCLDLKNMKSITIKHNSVGEQSQLQFNQLLVRPFPHHLEELRLVSCKISPLISASFVNQLSISCNLRKLALVQAQLSNKSTMDLCSIIKSARFLIDLDISWNELNCQSMLKIAETLSINRSLQYLNISWNFLTMQPSRHYDYTMREFEVVDQQQMSEKYKLNKHEFKEQSCKEQDKKFTQEPKMTREEYNSYLKDKEYRLPFYQHNKQISSLIATFIKHNKQLIHLDLSSTQMSEGMLWDIGSSLSRAPSLQSLHLSGNPGITQEFKNQLQKRIRCKPQQAQRKVNPEAGISSNLNNDILINQQKQQQLEDNMKVRNINRQPILDGCMTEQSLKNLHRLILQRQLGYKELIKGLGQWRILLSQEQKCWICDNTILTLVFWTEQFGLTDSEYFDSDRLDNTIEQIESINDIRNNPINKPIFYSQQSNWKPVEMLQIRDFCFSIDKDRPDIIQELKERNKIRKEVKNITELNIKEQLQYLKSYKDYTKDNFNNSDQIKRCLIKNLGFRQPQLINIKSILNLDQKQTNETIYVIPMFMKSGRSIYVVSLPNESQKRPNYYVHQVIASKRDEDPVVFVKTIKSNTVNRKFEKHNSVFKDWKEDNPQQINDCIEHDMKLWHVSRFVKVEEELQAVENVMKKHAEILKNVFIQAASRGTFPYLGWADFSMFCQRANIIDKKGASMSTIDRVFIVVDQSDENVGGIQPKSLMRFQFLEGLVRIANCKYRETGISNSYAEALELLIEECLVQSFDWRPWQEFRDEQLWTLDIQDVLHVNMKGIIQLTQIYNEPGKRFFKMADCLRLFTKDADCGVTEKDFYYCYGMSKMTVAKESQFHQKYFNIELVEFLEIICRTADTRYSDTIGVPLSQKVEFMLDSLFKLIGFKRLEVNFEVEEMSESDDEY